ncbi:MAG: hypothetical protein MJD61_12365, partial [Proteobacteria bacterium]|nr:hypothetical protein [Pseudomonadota bacterium]
TGAAGGAGAGAGAGGAGAGAGAGGAGAGGAAGFGTDDDKLKARALWERMKSDSYQDTWAPYPGMGDPADGGRPKRVPDSVTAHPDPVTHVRIFLNDVADSNPEQLADGAIIAKENYTADDPNMFDSITVMQKLKDYDPDNNDWFWAKFDPMGDLLMNAAGVALAGKIGKGGTMGCIPCHRSTDATGSMNTGDLVVINNEPLPFGNMAERDAAEALWTEMTQGGGYTQAPWMPFPGKPGFQASAAPHGAFVKLFLNAEALKRPFAPGDNAIVVKENYTAQMDTALDSVTVMKKMAGYDPETQDWFWAKYSPSGAILRNPAGIPLAGKIGKGGSAGCVPCHSGAGDGDYFFTNDAIFMGTNVQWTDVAMADGLWSTDMANYRTAFPRWLGPPAMADFMNSQAPHGTFVRLFVNDAANTSIAAPANGSIIVKENFSAAMESALGAITVMKKVQGYDPSAGDWFWAKYLPDGNPEYDPATGSPRIGRFPGCIACHAGAPPAGATDYVFLN